ncbi:MAG TPA: DinB family protein [Candidatus Acidoferrales bacterium]|nr:DinB family protein [Candidatus Acidoferrales bacterium]
MIPLETLRRLYDYNYWARDRQFEACRTLTEEQFLRPLGSSFSSVRDTLAHLVAVEWVWHERWRSRSPRAVPWPHDFPTVAAVEERWRGVERDVRDFLAQLSEEQLAGQLSYVNFAGAPCAYPLWQAMVHLVNHQTYHRGQVNTLLRQLGAKAAPLDLLLAADAGLLG